MSEFTKGYQWSQAAAKGLILALITIACNTVTYLLPDKAFVNILMFVVRTVASIWLLVTFMKQYAATTGQSPMGFAVCTVLLSSLVCAFYDAAAMAWIFPGLLDQVNEAVSQSMSAVPAEGMSIFEKMMDNLPKIMFFSTFIKDFLFGLIVAAIANSSTRKKDIFSDGSQEKDELA